MGNGDLPARVRCADARLTDLVVQHPSALTAPAVEGAFVSCEYNVAPTLVCGPPGTPRAGEHGAAIGRFAWVRPDGIALNSRTSPDDCLGLVLPEVGPGVDWRRVFYDETSRTWRIREGLNFSMLARGTVWARFKFGAYVGQQVYANVLDGSLLSGYADGYEATPWSIGSPAGAGGLAIISTWSKRL